MEFRVKASNAEGFGDYAYTESEHEKEEQNMGNEFLLPMLVGISMFSLLVAGACMAMFFVGGFFNLLVRFLGSFPRITRSTKCLDIFKT